MSEEVFRIRNEVSEIPLLHERMARMLRGKGFSEEVVHDLDLVAEEVLVNTISHGYPEPGPRTLEIRLACAGPRVTLEFRDDARPWNPLSGPEREEGRIGGWGLPLLRALADSAEYRREGAWNVLRIEKAEPRERNDPCP